MLKKSALILLVLAVGLVGFSQAAEAQEEDFNTWVRVIHLSPNADELTVALDPASEHIDIQEFDEWADMNYQEYSDFVEAIAGDQSIVLRVEDLELEEDYNFAEGQYYTIALTGLFSPEELEEMAERDDGVFAWLWETIFGEDPAEAYLLQSRVYEDDLTEVPEGEARVRLVHAAPGTEAVDLAFSDEDDALVEEVSFGEDSGYVETELTDDMEIRIAGTKIPLKEELVGLGIEEDHVHTIFLTGAPAGVDEPGIEVIVVADEPR